MGRSIVQQAASERSLWAAWARVASGSRMPGVDGVSLDGFARRLGENLGELSRLLRSGAYQAQPVKELTITRDGAERRLGVPTVRDRVAQRAFLEVLRRPLDVQLSEVSFAYRRGRSWLDALRKAERHRDAGLRWVFRGDIAAFFDEIDHAILEHELAEVVREERAVATIMQWVRAPALTSNGLSRPRRGVPQGAPIAPALANRYLATFDGDVDGRCGRLVRYADDIAVFCADEEQAHAARCAAERSLRGLRLRLNHDKSYLSSFDRGFSFLGWVFFRGDGYEESPSSSWVHPFRYQERQQERRR